MGTDRQKGFVQVPNEMINSLMKTRVPGEAMQVFLVILRKTVGFNKKVDSIPLSQFCMLTGIVKPSVIRALNVLKKMNVIFLDKGSGRVTRYGVNDSKKWKPLAKRLPSKGVAKTLTKGSKKANLGVAKRRHSIYNSSKDSKDSLSKNERVSPQINYQERIQDKLSRFDSATPFVEMFIGVIANENKSGKITQSRYLTILTQLHDVLTTVAQNDIDVFKAALMETTERQVGNVNYLKQVVKSHLTKREGETLKVTPEMEAIEKRAREGKE